VPVQVEDRLSGPCAGIHDDTVVRQPVFCSDFGDEVEHALVLVRAELRDVVERLDVPLGDDEQMRRRLRIDVADRDEAVRARHVVAVAVELAEEAVLVHAASTPSSETASPRTGKSAPTGVASSTSQGE